MKEEEELYGKDLNKNGRRLPTRNDRSGSLSTATIKGGQII